MSKKTVPADDQVKLKPLLGIRPGVYLTVLYSFILLVLLFLFLALPGIRKPGVVLVLKTEPEGAALRVDGVYMGTSGSKEKIFVPKGRHTLEAFLPGFETVSSSHEIPGRLFGSLFFPRRYPVEFTLKVKDPAAVFADSAYDFASWTFAGEPTASWQIPMSLSEGAYRIGPHASQSTAEILHAASRFAATRSALRDIIRAKMLLDSGGVSPSPAGISGSITDILVFLSENPGSSEWLAGLLPPESSAIVKASDWYKRGGAGAEDFKTGTSGGGSVNIAGLTFISAPGFMISENQVPKTLYEAFLSENPSWREEEIFPDILKTGDAITGISWYAAEAFCQWLTKRLPSSMADMEIRLPTEAEWEYAAKSGIGGIDKSAWEWCKDPFVHLPFIKTSVKAGEIIGSPERSLRGAAVSIEKRASLPPEFTSPFVSLRPVIAEKSRNE